MIYLDYLSTTPVDPRVVEVMTAALKNNFGNAASQHAFGLAARESIEKARQQVADLIQADSKEIIFTSCATESINLAIKGSAQFYQRQGKHIITMTTEHKAVLDTCAYLKSLGFEITYLHPKKNGLLDLGELEKAIRPDTILTSILHANNETGVIQDIDRIGKLLRRHGVWFHVDAAQSAGKIPIDLKTLSVDLMSFSSHKVYGPKGVGALFVRRNPRVQLIPQLHGGEQENKIRSGTLATHQIIGMGEAFAIAKNQMDSDRMRIEKLRDELEKKLLTLPGIRLNGDAQNRLYHCFNILIDNVPSELLFKNLPDVAISSGSACNAVDPEPSHVLMAMGLTRNEANCSVRISLGRFTTKEQIDDAAERIVKEIQKVREVGIP